MTAIKLATTGASLEARKKEAKINRMAAEFSAAVKAAAGYEMPLPDHICEELQDSQDAAMFIRMCNARGISQLSNFAWTAKL